MQLDAESGIEEDSHGDTTGNLRDRWIVRQRLRQTGMSSHYVPWHCHDAAPHLGPIFGLADATKKSNNKRTAMGILCVVHCMIPRDIYIFGFSAEGVGGGWRRRSGGMPLVLGSTSWNR